MDNKKKSAGRSKKRRYDEIAEQTAAAIEAEGTPPSAKNSKTIKTNPPELPRHKPPKPDGRYMICRMFFPSSGHLGFDTVSFSEELPPVETLREMILYETRLRLSDSIQELMDLYHEDEDAVT